MALSVARALLKRCRSPLSVAGADPTSGAPLPNVAGALPERCGARESVAGVHFASNSPLPTFRFHPFPQELSHALDLGGFLGTDEDRSWTRPLRPALTPVPSRRRIAMFYRMKEIDLAPSLCDRLDRHAGSRRISSVRGSAQGMRYLLFSALLIAAPAAQWTHPCQSGVNSASRENLAWLKGRSLFS